MRDATLSEVRELGAERAAALGVRDATLLRTAQQCKRQITPHMLHYYANVMQGAQTK